MNYIVNLCLCLSQSSGSIQGVVIDWQVLQIAMRWAPKWPLFETTASQQPETVRRSPNATDWRITSEWLPFHSNCNTVFTSVHLSIHHFSITTNTDKRWWLNLGTLFAGLEASQQSRCELPQRSSTISLSRSKLLVLLLSFNRKAEKLKKPSLRTNCALKLNFSAHKPKNTTRTEQPRTPVSTPTPSKFKLKLADTK